ncbi:MAG: ABC transporter substrate-binding protein, partial [Bacteroidia bacterium]|nr:ABC transporter substrate-binding protein [Bacteroidia bacterium]
FSGAELSNLSVWSFSITKLIDLRLNIKIGILIPQSDMFPALALDLLNGLKLALGGSENQAIDATFVLENIGAGTDETLLQKAQKLLVGEEVDITIAFSGSHILEKLCKLYDSAKKPLIHIDLGGNVLKSEHESPYVLHQSLNLWQSAYAAGKYAVQKFGSKAVVAASFYDGGYHLTEGFVRGFEDNGGEIGGYFVAPMDYKADSFAGMIDLINRENPDVIFALFSYNEGVKVFDLLSNSDINGKIPILAIPVMTDEGINDRNYKLEKVYSVASWAFDDDTPEMQGFRSQYISHHEDAPSIMALLGYEAGLIVLNAITEAKGIPKRIGEYFNEKTLTTPRGPLSINQQNETQVNTYKVRQFNFNQISYHNTVIDEMDASFSENLFKEFENLPYSSWKNPYICT